eukprot:COSAG02_NODE_5146_length_4591_cov_21.609973_3_plen_143_part_00
MQELQAAVDALDLERSTAGGLRALSVASAAIAEVPFPFSHQAWPSRRVKSANVQTSSTTAAYVLQADCRRVAATLEQWLNEALQVFLSLAPLSLVDEAAGGGGSVPRADAEREMDPAEQLWRKFLLLPPHVEIYGHHVPGRE